MIFSSDYPVLVNFRLGFCLVRPLGVDPDLVAPEKRLDFLRDSRQGAKSTLTSPPTNNNECQNGHRRPAVVSDYVVN
jgi:hypothetical protein